MVDERELEQIKEHIRAILKLDLKENEKLRRTMLRELIELWDKYKKMEKDEEFINSVKHRVWVINREMEEKYGII